MLRDETLPDVAVAATRLHPSPLRDLDPGIQHRSLHTLSSRLRQCRPADPSHGAVREERTAPCDLAVEVGEQVDGVGNVREHAGELIVEPAFLGRCREPVDERSMPVRP